MKLTNLLTTTFLFLSINTFGQADKVLPEDYSNYPDPLSGSDGKTIKSAEQWKTERNYYLDLFAENVYGNLPVDYDSLSFLTLEEQEVHFEKPTIFKRIRVTVYRAGNEFSFHFLQYTPLSKKAVPAFVMINHRAVDSLSAENAYKNEFWPADKIADAGISTAMLIARELSPDDSARFEQGVIKALYPEELKKPDGMKTISAWAWGASRIMDYLQKDNHINPEKIAVIGHSRGGKTALWCGANDERFSLVISNNSGNSGAALSRRPVGEQVSFINGMFPHWFCENYKKFNDNPDELPIDQHILISLMAPRAVYVASASEDNWADPLGEFYSLNMAVPVYKLFNPFVEYLELPKDNDTQSSKQIAYHIRKGGHGLFYSDWEKYIDFLKSLN